MTTGGGDYRCFTSTCFLIDCVLWKKTMKDMPKITDAQTKGRAVGWTGCDTDRLNLCFLCSVETLGDFKEGE